MPGGGRGTEARGAERGSTRARARGAAAGRKSGRLRAGFLPPRRPGSTAPPSQTECPARERAQPRSRRRPARRARAPAPGPATSTPALRPFPETGAAAPGILRGSVAEGYLRPDYFILWESSTDWRGQFPGLARGTLGREYAGARAAGGRAVCAGPGVMAQGSFVHSTNIC